MRTHTHTPSPISSQRSKGHVEREAPCLGSWTKHSEKQQAAQKHVMQEGAYCAAQRTDGNSHKPLGLLFLHSAALINTHLVANSDGGSWHRPQGFFSFHVYLCFIEMRAFVCIFLHLWEYAWNVLETGIPKLKSRALHPDTQLLKCPLNRRNFIWLSHCSESNTVGMKQGSWRRWTCFSAYFRECVCVW